MCTVTFIPIGKTDFILTSNRDEAPKRSTIPPDFYKANGVTMLFPKDELAGGTWIGLSNKSRLVCLLNGGFSNHERKEAYRMSRGAIVKDIMMADNAITTIEKYDFHDVEPFTLTLVEWKQELQLFELVWDGETKHFSQLALEPRLWSSSSLYNHDMKKERQQWFAAYLETNVLTSESILEFHETAGDNNDNYGIVMNRGFVKTTSITQVEKKEGLTMTYKDLQKDNMLKTNFEMPTTVHE